MAGASLSTSGDMDHNKKIDFLIRFKHRVVGVQFSLKGQDIKKIRVAKICASDLTSRFVFLSMSSGFFNRPNRKNGKFLYHFLKNIAKSPDEGTAGSSYRPKGLQDSNHIEKEGSQPKF